VWIGIGAYRSLTALSALSHGKESAAARDIALNRAARKLRDPVLIWEDAPESGIVAAPAEAPEIGPERTAVQGMPRPAN
jgi:multidrug efflux pump